MSSSPIPPPSSVPTDLRRSVRLTSLTQPNYPDCNHLQLLTVLIVRLA
jgi:hypothetical protein